VKRQCRNTGIVKAEDILPYGRSLSPDLPFLNQPDKNYAKWFKW
jgi:hypothetical protein